MRPRAVRHPEVAIGRRSGREAGPAFPIEDALLAIRWADSVSGLGYRVSFCLTSKNADEVLEVHTPPHRTALARIHRGNRVYWLTDCTGHRRAFVTLLSALTWIVPLAAREERRILKAPPPGWLMDCRLPFGPSPVEGGRGRPGLVAWLFKLFF